MNSISIIILNYNTHQLTCNCLRSIYAANRTGLDLEVILVDNGSSEAETVPFQNIFSDLIYIRSDVNLGFAKGNNLGLRYATKSFILLLNSDTVIVDPDTFLKSIQTVKQYDNQIVLTTRLLTVDGKPQVAYGPIPTVYHEFILTSFLYKLFPKRINESYLINFVADENRLIKSGYITATYLLFAREVLDSLPERQLYDQTFMYGEELFWASTWLRNGIGMYYHADVAVVHLVGQSSKKSEIQDMSLRRRYQTQAEHEFLRWRYHSFVVLIIYMLRIVRLAILSPFDKEIRLRLALSWNTLFRKETRVNKS